MSLEGDLYQEIRVLTQHLIQASICRQNRFPASTSRRGGIVEVHPADSMDLSAALKNVPYREAYSAMRDGRAYNMVLADGALIHFLYRVRPAKKEIIKHSLGFWPSPRLLPSDQTPWIYEEDEPFGDAIDERGVLPVPIRFDYAPEQFVEGEHPKCHATIGQYPNCRIAVAGPVRPGVFLDFILRNFYSREVSHLGGNFPFAYYDCQRSITDNEAKASLYFMVPKVLENAPMKKENGRNKKKR